MMRHLCKQFELWLAEPEMPMPEALKAHLERCPTCAERWQEEQHYRRLLDAVRSAPMPSTQVRWEQVQRRLAERAVQRAGRPLGWTATLVGAFGVLVMLAVGAGAWWLRGDSKANLASSSAPSRQVEAPAEKPIAPPVEIALTPTEPPEARLAGTVAPSGESLPRARMKPPESSPTELARLSSSAGIAGLRTYSARSGSPVAHREDPEANAPLEIEILPVEPIVPHGSEQTEYLAFNYQQHPTAEKKEDALIYSF